MNITKTITGHSVPTPAFHVREFYGEIPPDALLDVLTVKSVGLWIREYLPPYVNDQICQNFHENPGLHTRGDNVKGLTVGADLYGKDAKKYLESVREARNSVKALFENTVDVAAMLRDDIQKALPRGAIARPASHHGVEFNHSRGIGWTDSGRLALKFHEDLSQLGHPLQSELETSKVTNPIAFNVYPSVSEFGGELVLINLKPDRGSKERLGVTATGYPYPAEGLDDYDRLVIKPGAGDLVIVDGSFIHGVQGISGSGFRLLLNHFGGFISDREFITWS